MYVKREPIEDEKSIQGFFGKYRFLSNFHLAPVWLARKDGFTPGRDGELFPSTEHAYQAAKCARPEDRAVCLGMTAFEVKQWGKTVKLRSDWEQVKVSIMHDLCMQKFERHVELQNRLFDTGNKQLVELNDWGDTYWGVTREGGGKNLLGRILMLVRANLRSGTLSLHVTEVSLLREVL